MVMRLHGWGSLTLGHYTANFGSFKHCASRDITYLIFEVTSCDHVLRGLCDFVGGSPL